MYWQVNLSRAVQLLQDDPKQVALTGAEKESKKHQETVG